MGEVGYITAEDELDAWLADHNGGNGGCGNGGDGDGLFVLGIDESPVRASDKTINATGYQSPLSTGNCKPNPSLDLPRPLNDNNGLTPKQLFFATSKSCLTQLRQRVWG